MNEDPAAQEAFAKGQESKAKGVPEGGLGALDKLQDRFQSQSEVRLPAQNIFVSLHSGLRVECASCLCLVSQVIFMILHVLCIYMYSLIALCSSKAVFEKFMARHGLALQAQASMQGYGHVHNLKLLHSSCHSPVVLPSE